PGIGSLTASVSTVAGTGERLLKVVLAASVSTEVRDATSALVTLSDIPFEWYDKTTDTDGNPDVTGTLDLVNGEATVQLTGSALTAGQTGLLRLQHPTEG